MRPDAGESPDASQMTGASYRHLLAFGLAVLASKLLLIAAWGNATPLSDQWLGEAPQVYVPLLNAGLDWRPLFTPFSDHCITMTRLLDALLFQLNGGVWNPLLQMVVNAVLHTATLVLLLTLLLPACPPSKRGQLLRFAGLLFCLPLGFENTLWGFQSQIYFVLLFSLLFLAGIIRHATFSTGWWLGLLCGGLACLSFAAGAVTLLAGTAFLLLRWRQSGRHGNRDLAGLAVVASASVLALLALPAGSRTLPLFLLADPTRYLLVLLGLSPAPEPAVITTAMAAASPREFLTALFQLAAWPTLLFAPLVYAPLLRLLWQQWRQPPATGDARWLIAALGLWSLAQLLALAWARAKCPVTSRYADLLSIGLLVNFLCLLLPASGEGSNSRQGKPWRISWVVAVTLGLVLQLALSLSFVRTIFVPQIQQFESEIQHYLQEPGLVEPSSLSVREIEPVLNQPGIRDALPPNLNPASRQRQPAAVNVLLDHLRPLALLMLTMLPVLLFWRPADRRRDNSGHPRDGHRSK